MYTIIKQILAEKKQANRRAFTLIELLVVVLIIGILAAVAVPQYQKSVEKSKAVQLINNIRAVALAQQVYFMANGRYATYFDDLDLTIPELEGNYATTSDNDIYSLRGFQERNYNYILGYHNFHLGRSNSYGIAYDLNTNTLYCQTESPNSPAGKFCASLASTSSPITCPWNSGASEKCWSI